MYGFDVDATTLNTVVSGQVSAGATSCLALRPSTASTVAGVISYLDPNGNI